MSYIKKYKKYKSKYINSNLYEQQGGVSYQDLSKSNMLLTSHAINAFKNLEKIRPIFNLPLLKLDFEAKKGLIKSYLTSKIAQIIELINIAILTMNDKGEAVVGNDTDLTINRDNPNTTSIIFPQLTDTSPLLAFTLIVADKFKKYAIPSYIYTPIIMGYIISLAVQVCGFNFDHTTLNTDGVHPEIPYILYFPRISDRNYITSDDIQFLVIATYNLARLISYSLSCYGYKEFNFEDSVFQKDHPSTTAVITYPININIKDSNNIDIPSDSSRNISLDMLNTTIEKDASGAVLITPTTVPTNGLQNSCLGRLPPTTFYIINMLKLLANIGFKLDLEDDNLYNLDRQGIETSIFSILLLNSTQSNDPNFNIIMNPIFIQYGSKNIVYFRQFDENEYYELVRAMTVIVYNFTNEQGYFVDNIQKYIDDLIDFYTVSHIENNPNDDYFS